MSRSPDGPVRVLLAAPLCYDVGERSVHCPIAEVEIGGTRTKMIVDTGATDHVLTLEVARQAGLPLTSGAPGTDVAGATVPTSYIDRVEVSIANLITTFSDVPAIEGPAPFAAWGVGGFLSPQRLHADATVVLDLVRNELIVLAGSADACRTHLAERFKGCLIVAGDRHLAGTLGVKVAVLPHDEVVGIFDSGAGSTDVAAVAVAGATSSEGASARGVSGSEFEARRLSDQVLAIAGVRFPVANLGVREEIPAPEEAPPHEVPQALIGMDVLRGTVLAIPPLPSGRLWWFVPGG